MISYGDRFNMVQYNIFIFSSNSSVPRLWQRSWGRWRIMWAWSCDCSWLPLKYLKILEAISSKKQYDSWPFNSFIYSKHSILTRTTPQAKPQHSHPSQHHQTTLIPIYLPKHLTHTKRISSLSTQPPTDRSLHRHSAHHLRSHPSPWRHPGAVWSGPGKEQMKRLEQAGSTATFGSTRSFWDGVVWATRSQTSAVTLYIYIGCSDFC